MGPPSNHPPKEGGIPPHPPSVEGGSREPGTEVRGGYIANRGKPIAFSLPRLPVSLDPLVVHVWFLLTPANCFMASCLKIVGNEARCYCSVHQGADVARGTLERVVHPYPRRHAHTWPRAPCYCLWLLCRVFVLVQSQRTNVHSFLTQRERGGPHPVLDSAECYNHSGWVCDCHYYGVGKSTPPDSD